MKYTFTGMLIALVLTLALVIGAVALAENAEPEIPEMPAIGGTEAEQTPARPEAPSTDAATDSTALQDAFRAYEEARSSAHQEELEAELKGYVESGKLTQEQADLILNWYNEQKSLKNGTCPNCGYSFQDGQGKGGRMNGGFGGRGGCGNGGFGGKGGRGMMGMNGMNGRQPAQGQDGGSANGMSFLPDAQMAPDMSGTEGI